MKQNGLNIIIYAGFPLEIFLFVFAGFYSTINIPVAVLILVFGFVVAVIVGNALKEIAVLNQQLKKIRTLTK